MSEFDYMNGEFDPNNLPGNTGGTSSDNPTNITMPTTDATATTPGEAGPATTPPTLPNTPPVVQQLNQDLNNPALKPNTEFKPTLLTPGQGTTLGVTDDTYLTNVQGKTPVVKGVAQTATAPTKIAATTYDAYTGGEAAQATAQQGELTNPNSLVKAETQSEISPELKKTLDDFNKDLDAIGIDPNATVQGQYAKLMNFGPTEVPAWAQGAYKKAEQVLAARGLGSSTIAGESITTALMQAALPIASQDAQAVQTLNLTKLDKKAQGVFLRAGYIANLDMANLNNRQQAAVTNAQSFLAFDLKNLDNRQQTAIINTQSRLQKMLADNAAVNAARQFNASTQTQTDQFYSDLGARVDMFSVSQKNAMETANVSEANAMTASENAIQNDRDKFNSGLTQLIQQSNTNYLRGINTQNNALVNQAALVNSQNLLGISNTATANILQLLRDQTAFSFQSGENNLDRAQQTALTQMQNQEWYKRFNTTQKDSFWKSVGSFVFGVASDASEGINWGKLFGGSTPTTSGGTGTMDDK